MLVFSRRHTLTLSTHAAFPCANRSHIRSHTLAPVSIVRVCMCTHTYCGLYVQMKLAVTIALGYLVCVQIFQMMVRGLSTSPGTHHTVTHHTRLTRLITCPLSHRSLCACTASHQLHRLCCHSSFLCSVCLVCVLVLS